MQGAMNGEDVGGARVLQGAMKREDVGARMLEGLKMPQSGMENARKAKGCEECLLEKKQR